MEGILIRVPIRESGFHVSVPIACVYATRIAAEKMKPKSPGRFDAAGLYQALDAQRRAHGLSWTQVAKEVGVSVSTLTRTKLGGRMEVDGMLAMARWLGRSAESFTFGHEEPQ
jgi:hypothetical protein